MIDYYGESPIRARQSQGVLPEHGVTPESNPGEGPGLRYSGTPGLDGTVQSGAAQARRGPTGDIGSQVGTFRNLEFSAGGRSHRISSGPYIRA